MLVRWSGWLEDRSDESDPFQKDEDNPDTEWLLTMFGTTVHVFLQLVCLFARVFLQQLCSFSPDYFQQLFSLFGLLQKFGSIELLACVCLQQLCTLSTETLVLVALSHELYVDKRPGL